MPGAGAIHSICVTGQYLVGDGPEDRLNDVIRGQSIHVAAALQDRLVVIDASRHVHGQHQLQVDDFGSGSRRADRK